MDTFIIWNIILLIFAIGLLFGIAVAGLFYWLAEHLTQNTNLNGILNILVRQTARWSLAAEQDTNPIIAVLHANYGAGYLWAIKDIATDREVKRATNVIKLRIFDFF